MELVAADIGGTHARFAIAEVADGQVVKLGEPITLKTAEYDSLAVAWAAFGRLVGRPLPRAAAIAVASPVVGEIVQFTNSDWVIRPALINEQLGVDRHLLLNDFGAVGHAVQHATPDQFHHICGPEMLLPDTGVISICGPGTGLGVAQLLRLPNAYHVLETEGGHLGFSPVDASEDALVDRLRNRFDRVSAERICAGPGLVAIYAALAAEQGWTVWEVNERSVWRMALAGDEAEAVTALERYCAALGSVAGDLALAHGAKAVVIAGGLGLRLKDRLAPSRFAQRFAAKGRFQEMMATLPVMLITHPQPGLFGAAAAFAQRFR